MSEDVITPPEYKAVGFTLGKNCAVFTGHIPIKFFTVDFHSWYATDEKTFLPHKMGIDSFRIVKLFTPILGEEFSFDLVDVAGTHPLIRHEKKTFDFSGVYPSVWDKELQPWEILAKEWPPGTIPSLPFLIMVKRLMSCSHTMPDSSFTNSQLGWFRDTAKRRGRKVMSEAEKQANQSQAQPAANKAAPAVISPSKAADKPEPAKVQVAPVLAGKPAASPTGQTYLIDSTNVCRSFLGPQDVSLLPLLCLANHLVRNTATVICLFDANTFYVIDEAGKHAEAALYRRLLKEFPSIFIEVPGGMQADDFILRRANTLNCPIITNDQYNKPTDSYRGKYPKLFARPELLIKGKVVAGAITLPALNLDISCTGTIEAAHKQLRDALLRTDKNKQGS
ncbi:MAG: hypothetical protein WCN95_10545 [bacterium]